MKTASTFIFLVYAVTAAILWGIEPIAHKMILSKVSLVTLSAILMVILLICTSVIVITYRKRIATDLKRLDARTIAYFTVATIFTSFAPLLIYLNLIKDHPSHIVTAITYSSPFFTLFLAWYFLNEPITALSAFGVMLVVMGITCLSWKITKKSNVY